MNPPRTLLPVTLNFAFLARHDAVLVHVAALAERYFPDDPTTALIKLRQFGELLAQQVAARVGVFTSREEPQAELLRRLRTEAGYPKEILDLFHDLRRLGNDAVHEHRGDHAGALNALKVARSLGIWFHKTFGDRNFKAGPFQPPAPPADPTPALKAEIQRLRAEHDAKLTAAERRAAEAEAKAAMAAEDRAFWERYAAETEAAQATLAGRLNALQAAADALSFSEQAQIKNAAEEAAKSIDLDESTTRAIIDVRLQALGWEADTQALRHSAGTRPAKGRNMAIAEWPTASGPADYAFFIGTTCVGVVEAKRKRKNVSAAIDQAGRYARGIVEDATFTVPVGGPWPAESGADSPSPYRVPFLFATNGRGYLKQIDTQSGIWFRDARAPTNHRRALLDWYTPDGLLALLGQDQPKAQAELAEKPFDFGFDLRPYQRRAIEAVERSLADDRCRTLLLAMATGTGKTKLAIAMLYRLLATRRFRRVCFVVDRTSLGDQAGGEFRTTRVVGANTFADTSA